MSSPPPSTDYDSLAKRFGIDLAPSEPAPTSQGDSLTRAASTLGIDPVDLGSIISFESAGSFDPHKVGGAGNKYKGLIQFGPDEQKKYYRPNDTFDSQLQNGVVPYFQDRFRKAGRNTSGASLEDLYTTVIAGNPNANRDAKDANGVSARIGTQKILAEHRPKVLDRFFGGQDSSRPQTDYDALEARLFGNHSDNTNDGTDYNALEQQLGLTDNHGGTPISPTLPATMPSPQIAPVPESQPTIDAQTQAAADPTKPRGMVLLSPGEVPKLDDPKWQGFGAFNMPDPVVGDRVAMVNLAMAKKLKLRTPKDIQQFLDKNPRAMETFGIHAETVADTSQGPTVHTTAPDGTELNTSIVNTPETAQQQIHLDQANHPEGTSTVLPSPQPVIDARLGKAPFVPVGAGPNAGYNDTVAPDVVPSQPAAAGIARAGKQSAQSTQPPVPGVKTETPGATPTDNGVKIGEDIPTDFKEHVTFENKPDGIDNKEYFIQSLVPKLAARLPGVDASDIEKTLRETLHHDSGTPLRDIQKGQEYAFQMTPEFYEDAQKNHDQRYVSAKQSLKESLVTDANPNSDAAKQLGLSDEEISNITTDPAFLQEAQADKTRYEDLLTYYKDMGSDHPEIMAKRGLHYLSESGATQAIKQDAKEKDSYQQWLKSTGYDNFDYRQTHSKAFEADKANVLSQYGTFDALASKNKENVDYLKGHPWTAIASKLPSFFDNETMQGYNATQKASSADYTKLSDAERTSAEEFGKGLKAYLPNEPFTQFHTGVATGLGSDLLDIGAGVLRFGNPIFDWATGGKGAEWMNQAAEMTRQVGQASEPDSAIGSGARAVGMGVGQLPGIAGATILADGNPVLGFALHSALTGSNKPVEEQTAGIIKNSTVGGVFEGQAILEGIGGDVLDSLIKKLGLDSTATTATIIKTLYEKGKHITFLGGVGGGQAALEGGDKREILKSAALMASLGLTGFGHKPTGPELAKLDGKILRMPDENDKPIDVLFTKTNEGVELTDVTGKVPDGVQQAIIAPTEVKPVIHKPSFGEPVADEAAKSDVSVPPTEGVKVEKATSEEPVIEAGKQIEKPESETQSQNGAASNGQGELKEPEKITSTKNATVDTERESRDLSPVEKEASKDFGTVWANAKAELEKNPDAGINLVKELKDNPKKVPTDEENALLLHRKIQLRNQFDERANALIKATESGDTAEVAAARIRLAPVQDALDDLDKVTTAAGTAAGRGLNARRMMAKQDFTLVALELRTRAANGGRPLTDTEFSDLKKVADDYKAKADLLEQHLADRNAVIAKMETNWPNSRVISAAENLVKKLDVRAEAARSRLAKRGNVFTAGLDPLALKDLAEIGASHIATAGLDFAKWTKKMIDEFGDNIKPHLDQLWKASNDVFDGLGARDKRIGNRPTDETKLKAWKSRAAKRLDELNQKVETGDFTRKKRVPFTKFDAEAIRLKADVERIVRTFNKGIRKKEMAARPFNEKAQDVFTKYRRFSVLSGPSTIGKLTAAAVGRVITEPLERIVEHGWGKILPKLAKQMDREYGFRTVAEAKALTEMFTSGFKDAWKNFKNQDSDLETVFGKPGMDRTMLEYAGSIHGALKAPTKRGVFARNMELGFAKVIKDGGDPLDPAIQAQVGLRAYHASERAIFMQPNRLTDMYSAGLRSLERPGKNGKTPVPSKILATVMKTLMPIVKIPTNFVGEVAQHGALLPGLYKLRKAYKAGIEKLPPDDAEQIIRWLTKGSLGAGALLLGYKLSDSIGGYYQGKRDEKDVKPGDVRMFGVSVPSLLLHTPLLEAMQIGANFHRVMDSRLKKSDEDTQGPGMAAMASAIGLLEEVPFVKETANVSKLLDPKTRMDFVYDIGKNVLIPQLSSQTASYLDKPKGGSMVPLFGADPVKRKPEGLWQTIETGVPGLRKNVPEAAPDKSRVSPDAQDVQLKHSKIATEIDKIEQMDAKGEDSTALKQSLQDKLDNKINRLTQTEAERANKILGLSGADAYEGQVEDAPAPTFKKYNKNADGIIERTLGWAQAIGTDPLDAFDKLLAKGETFQRMENGTIIVKRMSQDASGAERKRLGGGAKSVKLDHEIPLEIGGTNAQSNLRLVTTEEWESYTPMENYLAGALHDGKVSGKEAQDLIRGFKAGSISVQDIVQKVGEPYKNEITPSTSAKPSKALRIPGIPKLKMPSLH